VKPQSARWKDLIWLTKYWKHLYKEKFTLWCSKSYLIELIVIHLLMQNPRLVEITEFMKLFLKLIANFKQIHITWRKRNLSPKLNCKHVLFPIWIDVIYRPVMVDPDDPFKNVADNMTIEDWQKLFQFVL
jgi:hypothetical protein